MPRGKQVVKPSPHYHGTNDPDGWTVVHTPSNLRIVQGLKVSIAQRALLLLEQPKVRAAVERCAMIDRATDADIELVTWVFECCTQANRGQFDGTSWWRLDEAGLDAGVLRGKGAVPTPDPPPAPEAPPAPDDLFPDPYRNWTMQGGVLRPPPEPAPVEPAPVEPPPPEPTTPPEPYDPDPLRTWRTQAEAAARVTPTKEKSEDRDNGAVATLDREGDTLFVSVDYHDTDAEMPVELTLTVPGHDHNKAVAMLNGREIDLDWRVTDEGALVFEAAATARGEVAATLDFQFLNYRQGDVDWLPLRRLVELAYQQNPTLTEQLATELERAASYDEATGVPMAVIRNGGRA
jgi:hypothetical protein